MNINPDISILYCDGSSSPHTKKPAGYGYIIYNSSEANVLTKGTGEVPSHVGLTNNCAEYYSLIKGLEQALSLGISSIVIKMDSQLIVYQVMGKYRVKDAVLKGLHARVLTLLTYFEHFNIEWIRREFNRADELSRV
jgi:ribonuclease HI